MGRAVLSERTKRPVQSPTIILIDDDPVVGDTVQRLAERAFPDAYIVWAKNGLIGLEAIQRHIETVRLVVLDVHMPLLDGRLVAAQIRTLAPHVPVLPFSAHEPMLASLGEMGCVAPVIKHPAAMGKLTERMREAMNTPITATPQTPWMSAMRQSAEGVLAFTCGQTPEMSIAGGAYDGRLTKVSSRLEQYCARFPKPAREVAQALKEIREILS